MSVKKIFLIIFSCIILFLAPVNIAYAEDDKTGVSIGGESGIGIMDFDFQLDVSKSNDNEGNMVSIGIYKGEKKIGTNTDAWNSLYDKYRSLINLIYGIMVLTCFGGIIYNALKLGSSGDNPQNRKSAIVGLLFCGGGISLLGVSGLYFALAMNIL